MSSRAFPQPVLPTLAGSLARLRRAPGRDRDWHDGVLRALEELDPSRHERMRRRMAFARSLAALAELPVEGRAVLSAGLFFHELVSGQTPRGRATARNAWLNYLMRNDDWLSPAIGLCEAVDAGWEAVDTKAAAIAKLTAAFDYETLERNERPFRVLRSLTAEIESPRAQELIPLLWSEEGQELCDHHFRRHPQGYKLTGQELRDAFALLRGLVPQRNAEAELTPRGLLRRALPSAEGEFLRRRAPAIASAEAAASAQPAGENFDQRRQALRARSSQPASASSQPSTADEQPDAEEPAPDVSEAEHAGLEQAGPAPIQPVREVTSPARREEVPMEQLRSISPVRPGPAELLDMMQRLRDVSLRLGEIQRMAHDAEQLLTGLAPQLDGLGTWISELDAVVDRWRGRAEMDRAA